jgi:selenide,water dikinase
MAQLNRIPSVIAVRNGVRAATDITGFGLAGHAAGIARESRLTLEIRAASLPLLPGALELATAFPPGGLKANRRQFGPLVRFATPEPEAALQAMFFDPQTSGGLLLLVPEANREAVLAELPHARAIGVARPAGEHPIVVA